MDPNLFRIDWNLLLEVLAVVVFLSFVVERALALVFEHRLYVTWLADRGFKEPIAFALAYLVCRNFDIDALAIVLKAEGITNVGLFVTAGLVAGGSKASIKLFHDVLGAKSSMQKDRDALLRLQKSTAATRQIESVVKTAEAALMPPNEAGALVRTKEGVQ